MVKLYRLLLGFLDTLSGDFLEFLSCFQDRKRKRPGEGPRLLPPLSQKKSNGFARFTKMGLSRNGGSGGGGLVPLIPPLGVVTAIEVWDVVLGKLV